ncbi:MAG: Omp28-related outer membrane protein [Salibacteraceae bacterium]|jgi:hypothetical protein|nr:Omp28-related outer membrane protein [Salibacteraceae bacterium]
MRRIILSAFGVACFGLMNAQTIVSTSSQNRNVVLEEFTGIHCTFCPDGHKKANELKAANPGRVVLINIHSGGYATPGAGEPDFRTPYGEPIDDQAGIAGYPAGTINRENFVSSGWTQGSGTAMSRGSWVSAANVVKAESSPVNIAAAATIDINTKLVTVLVEAYYTDMNATGTMDNINVAILQNEVKGPQTGASSFYPEMIDANGDYTHNHMLRHMITGQWGDEVTVADGPFISRTYTYTLPADINGVDLQLGDLEIVAFIADNNQYIYTGDYASISYTGLDYNLNLTVENMEIAVPSTCGSLAENVSFDLRNNGTDVITSATYDVSLNGEVIDTRTWTGTLNSLQKTTIEMTPIVLSGVALSDEYIIKVDFTSVNGASDEDATDNADNVSLFRPTEGGATLTVTLTTDKYASEVGYYIKKKGAPKVLEVTTGSLANLTGTATTAQFVETLPWEANGCFEVVITDTDGDGMSTSAGTGLVITDSKGNVIVNIAGDSYTESGADNYFHTEWPLATEEVNGVAFSLYPNPTSNSITIQGVSGSANIKVYDLQGRIVMNKRITNNTLDVSSLNSGIYNVAIESNGNTSVEKLSIVK